jgi:hypothetical protein
MTEQEWAAKGVSIARSAEAATWALGDWLVEGRKFETNRYRKASAITGYSESHLCNLYRVSVAFPPGTRRQVSWAVHRETARETDADRRLAILKMAEESRWTQRDLIQHIAKTGTTERTPTGHPGGYQHVQTKCPECGHVFRASKHRVVPTDT